MTLNRDQLPASLRETAILETLYIPERIKVKDPDLYGMKVAGDLPRAGDFRWGPMHRKSSNGTEARRFRQHLRD